MPVVALCSVVTTSTIAHLYFMQKIGIKISGIIVWLAVKFYSH